MSDDNAAVDIGSDNQLDGNENMMVSDEVDLKAVYDVPLQVSAVLGRAQIKISQLIKLSRGSVIELDRKVGEAIDVFVNDRRVARGEIVLVDNKIGITLTEIIKNE